MGWVLRVIRSVNIKRKSDAKKYLFLMMEFSFNTFTVNCNVCDMDSFMEGANKNFKNVLSYQLYKMFSSKLCNFLFYTLYRSTVGAGLEMPKQRRLSVELWMKTLAWKWRCPIMCRIKIYLKGFSKTRPLFIAS